MAALKHSKIIVFEGPDGSGKSTYSTRIHNILKSNKIPSILIKYNGIKFINDTINTAKRKKCNLLSIILLNSAAFFEVVNHVLLPSIKKKRVIILDRYYYTIIARGMINKINNNMLINLFRDLPKPDLTFYLDLPVEVCLKRKQKANFGKISYWEAGMNLKFSRNKKKSFIEYQSKLKKIYLKLNNESKFNIMNLFENDSIEKVLETIKRDLISRKLIPNID